MAKVNGKTSKARTITDSFQLRIVHISKFILVESGEQVGATGIFNQKVFVPEWPQA
jgi:hypothetical protein